MVTYLRKWSESYPLLPESISSIGQRYRKHYELQIY